MVLEAIDLQLETAKQEKLHVSGPLSVEHIMPQSASLQAWPLPLSGETGEDIAPEVLQRRARLIHTLGNLTLLTQPLNSAISNGPFSKKRPEIAMQSKLRLNAYFQRFGDGDAWTEDNILQRGSELFDVARSIWPRPATPTQ